MQKKTSITDFPINFFDMSLTSKIVVGIFIVLFVLIVFGFNENNINTCHDCVFIDTMPMGKYYFGIALHHFFWIRSIGFRGFVGRYDSVQTQKQSQVVVPLSLGPMTGYSA